MTPVSAVVSPPAAVEATALPIDEERFRIFYERTARSLRMYLRRLLTDGAKADDLLQEAYLRILTAKLPVDMEEEHRKRYLFRIATNLARDELSRRRPEPLKDYSSREQLADDISQKKDVDQFLNQLSSRDRELLWLAYVERFDHAEIAAAMRVRPPSVRPMLARARSRFGQILKRGGFSVCEKGREQGETPKL